MSNGERLKLPILLATLFLWYYASIIYAASSQFYAKSHLQSTGLVENVFSMLFVAFLQMIAGTLLGLLIMALAILSVHKNGPFSSTIFKQMRKPFSSFNIHISNRNRKATCYLLAVSLLPASLHAAGSFFLNLGYASSSSASFVLMIKLIEPIQAFLVDIALGKRFEMSRTQQIMYVSYFAFVTAFLVFRLHSMLQNGRRPFWTIALVLLSGMFMSFRNANNMLVKKNKSTIPKNKRDASFQIALLEGVEDFIYLSFGGALVLLPFVLFLFLVLLCNTTTSIPLMLPFPMVLSHGIYHVASLSVFCFVAAPVNTLLNCGNQLFSVLFVRIWSGEETISEIILLASISAGAITCYLSNTSRRLWILVAVVTLGLYGNMKRILLAVVTLGLDGNMKGSHFLILKPESPLLQLAPNLLSPTNESPENCRVQFNNINLRICHVSPKQGNNSFEDDLGPAVVLKLLENKFRCSTDEIPVLNLATHSRTSNEICLFNLGSSLNMIKSGDHIWGTGVSSSQQNWDNNFPTNVTIHAVRGPDTQAFLQENFHVALENVGLGDPGFLAPSLYHLNRNFIRPDSIRVKPPKFHKATENETNERICFLPHAKDFNDSQLLLLPSKIIITLNNSWLSVAQSITSCDFVASSSLHGIVLADAIGIPSLWFQFPGGDRENEEEFQFVDYFKTIGRTDKTPTRNFSKVFDPKSYHPIISETERTALVHKTISSFPYELFSTTTHVKSKRTLVIIMGTVRGGEKAWASMYNNLLKPNSADLALLVPRNTPRSSSLFNHSKFVWEHNEYSDWGFAIDKFVPGGNQTGWRELQKFKILRLLGVFGGTKETPRGSGSIIFLLRVFVQEKIKLLGLVEQYDRFVLTRSDHYYGCLQNLDDLDNRYLWVPRGEDYFGITDRHFVCNSSHIMKALNILPPVVLNPGRYWSFRGNPERLIKLRWEEEGLWESVRRFPRMMFTCAVLKDRTRWRRKGKLVPEGVYLKYDNEYTLTKATCKQTKVNPFTGDACKFCNSIIMN